VQSAELQPGVLQPAKLNSGYIVPAANAVVRIESEKATVSAGGWNASFEGIVATDVAGVATGQVSPRLEALAKNNAAAAAVASWREHSWLPLTPLDAVRLDGFDTLFVELVGRCNERCLHCYAESSPTVDAALDRATCESIVDDGVELGFRRIQFTGGDPLLCTFLPDLVARASRYETREIYTNGLALDAELLDRLAPHRPSFAFSYYSHDAATHDAITRTPGSHRRTRNAIARAVSLGLGVRCSIVVMSSNVADVDATYEDLHSIGVTSISASSSMAAGRGSLFAWKPRDRAPAGGHRAPNATAEGKLAVTYEGNVVPCIFNRGRTLGRVDAKHRLRDVMAAAAATGTRASETALTCTSCKMTDAALSILDEEP
jgi:MoaA/NifB/PqqE/SkfB family radical SAM enzyme